MITTQCGFILGRIARNISGSKSDGLFYYWPDKYLQECSPASTHHFIADEIDKLNSSKGRNNVSK